MVRLRIVAACTALLAPLALAGCGDTEFKSVPDRPDQVERFEQRKASAIDILFVIDDSGSMAAHQANLSENFEHFLRLIDPDPLQVGEDGEVDYRLAIATTDVVSQGAAGRLIGHPPILQPSEQYNPQELFEQRVVVGTKGSAREEGFRAAELAVQSASRLSDESGDPLFLRSTAYLYIIIVSDEDDESRDEVRYFERRFRSLKGKGDEQTVIVSAIAGPPSEQLPPECLNEDGNPRVRPGLRYAQMAALTGGTVGNICQAEWGATLEELAYTGLGLRKRFQLKYPPRYIVDDDGLPDLGVLFESVEVQYPCSTSLDSVWLSEEVCGRVLDRCDESKPVLACVPRYDPNQRAGFWFEPLDNTIVFAGDAIPGPGSAVEIRYKARWDSDRS